ncbi:nicotinate phosphoribosyltransferase isoform X3 [Drosophila willistoni]|uniref:nicotinate phosphoribosyltransferase isoform X3 n=1 Tax=Drosophila willistoni TaxID=7260 RepID=UPI001F077442|nr:nicotinate phosphoribosyltransferase isoform X3 [Drosophila willistoni]
MNDRELGCNSGGGQFMDRGRMNQNGVVQPLLTDLYQITMAYAYWKSDKTDDQAVFDLFFRNNPFHGEFTIFAGLEECLKFLDSFHYSQSDIEYLKQTLPEGIENEFFEYLGNLTARDVTLYAIDEGTVAFPRVPIIKIEGPLIIVQLLETTLLTLVNYASLMATNAARYRMVAGKHVKLLEFGLRRAQGPDGGLSASKYSYTGGFDGTSNVLAGKLFNIPVKGTHAHAYITSFSSVGELKTRLLKHKQTGIMEDLLEHAIRHRQMLSHVLDVSTEESSEGELAAMVSYAIAFPDGFMALVDTYDVKSRETEQITQLSSSVSSVKTDINNSSTITTTTKATTTTTKATTAPTTSKNGFSKLSNGHNKIKINGHKTLENGQQNGNHNGSSLTIKEPNQIVSTSIITPTTTTTKTTASSNGSAYLPKYVEKSFRLNINLNQNQLESKSRTINTI